MRVLVGLLLLVTFVGLPTVAVRSTAETFETSLAVLPGDVTPEVAYRPPLRRGTIARRFDPPAKPWLPGHRGVDLVGEPGAAVYAAGGGTVSFAGDVAGRGVVSVVHPNGLRTTYEPVLPAVSATATVPVGGRLGVLGTGHPACGASACLHWGLRRGDQYLDPLSLLGLGRMRLLPPDGVEQGG